MGYKNSSLEKAGYFSPCNQALRNPLKPVLVNFFLFNFPRFKITIASSPHGIVIIRCYVSYENDKLITVNSLFFVLHAQVSFECSGIVPWLKKICKTVRENCTHLIFQIYF